jgi:propionyl-CoA synthetase
MCGWRVAVLGDDGAELPPDTEGAVVLRLPLPPGAMLTLWNADARFVEAYLERFPGYYLTGDYGRVDEDGYVYVMGRADDVINVAGHRLSTGAMEEVIATHPAVAESAVIGVHDPVKGQLPRAFVVLKTGFEDDEAGVGRELIELVRAQIGPVAAMREVDIVPALPKTRSGKVLRATMRGLADQRDLAVPSTIEDVAVFAWFRDVLQPQRRTE